MPEIVEPELSLSVNVADALNDLPHLTDPALREGVARDVECFVMLIVELPEVVELYSVSPAKLAITVLPVPTLPAPGAVIVTAATSSPSEVVVPVPALDTAVPE